MTIKYTTFKTAADLNTAIDKVVADSKTMQDKIQNVAFGILCHAVKHGDYTMATRLVNELADGVRKVALVSYFEMAGLKVNEAGDGFSDWAGADFIKSKAEELKTTMWWTLKPANPYKGFDLKAELARLLKRAENESKKAEKFRQAGDNDSAEMVKVDASMLAQLRSLSTAPVAAELPAIH